MTRLALLTSAELVVILVASVESYEGRKLHSAGLLLPHRSQPVLIGAFMGGLSVSKGRLMSMMLAACPRTRTLGPSQPSRAGWYP